ncbi:MAG: hypothetical protein LLG02_16805 [Pelosinus sp.]|nr:hypothetical protein [Pelosinus sp.]
MSYNAEAWQIEARAFHIPFTLYVHQFWTLVKPDGKIIDQLHGMAVDGQNRLKAVGTPLHRIQVVSLPDSTLSAQPNQSRAVCASGLDCRARWQAVLLAMDELNALGLRYLLFRQNSNSVFQTVGEIMNVHIPRLGIAPGLGEILSQDIVNRHKYLF